MGDLTPRSRIFVLLFMLVWCTGWFAGAYRQYHAADADSADRLMAVLMALLGLGVAGFMLVQVFRNGRAEVLRLYPDRIELQTGVPPMGYGYSHPEQPPQARSSRQLSIAQVLVHDTLRLRETSNSNRLTVDLGHERLDLARDATELQREWLHQLLQQCYSPEMRRTQ
ncbi:MAG: hypothetical protein AB7V26_02640 [Lysobacterales bacterium]